MPDWKVNWEFEGSQSAMAGRSQILTWTETWYQNADPNIELALLRASLVASGWLKGRLSFMSDLYRCTQVRVSDQANPRMSKVALVQGGWGTLPHANANFKAAQVNCALLVDFSVLPLAAGDIVHHRRALFRGLDVSMINGNLPVRTSTSFVNATRFFNWLGVGPAPQTGGRNVQFARDYFREACEYKMRVQSPAPVRVPIEALTIHASQRSITITADIPAAVGDKVNVTGVTFPRGVNRIWTVEEIVAAGQFRLGRSRVRLAGTWDNNGWARLQQPVLAFADQYIVPGLRNRQTSGPFGGPRGRRSRE